MCVVVAGVIVNAELPPDKRPRLQGAAFNGPPTQVLVLRNMVGPGEVDEDLEEEVGGWVGEGSTRGVGGWEGRMMKMSVWSGGGGQKLSWETACRVSEMGGPGGPPHPPPTKRHRTGPCGICI